MRQVSQIDDKRPAEGHHQAERKFLREFLGLDSASRKLHDTHYSFGDARSPSLERSSSGKEKVADLMSGQNNIARTHLPELVPRGF